MTMLYQPEEIRFFQIGISEPKDGATLEGLFVAANGTFKAYYCYDGDPERYAIQIDDVQALIGGSPVEVDWEQQQIAGNWKFLVRMPASGTVTIEVKLIWSSEARASATCRFELKPVPFDFAGWTRVEPRCRADDFAGGLEARTADPLWFLTRQWQTGEFQGEDTGSPLEAHLTYSTQAIERIRLGASGQVGPLSPAPLEMVVEEERPDLKGDWRTRVQAGQQFERLLCSVLAKAAPGVAAAVLAAYRNEYPFAPDLPSTEEGWAEIDVATRSFLQFMAGRVVDGGTLLPCLDWSGHAQHQVAALGGITPDQLLQALKRLVHWCTRLNIGPVGFGPAAWRNPQLDYRFQINPTQENALAKTCLSAPSYRNGDLDWYAFDVAGGLQGAWAQQKPIAMHPTRISVGGASPRWWTFEDAAIDFGRLNVARPDLAKLLLMEFALLYGDDWFALPLHVAGAGLVRIDGLAVSNVFGETLALGAAWQPEANPLRRWEMFTLSPLPDASQPGVGDPDLPGIGPILFVPPVAGFREESPALEEVRFLRDEGANMVWAVEQTVRDGLGRPMNGFDDQRERRARQILAQGRADRETSTSGVPRYRLATVVPENWIPFIPGVYLDQGQPRLCLCRAQMLKNTDDEAPSPVKARSRLLELAGDPLLRLEEATVPRSGLRVQLTAQRVRTADGRTYVWLGRTVTAGRGEGSSGLKFDVLTE